MAKERGKTQSVRLRAWLTRSQLVGYEIFSNEPEMRGISNDCMWQSTEEDGYGGNFYFSLPDDVIPVNSPLFLKHGKKRRIWLTVEITGRHGK